MNRALTPISELEHQLAELLESAAPFPTRSRIKTKSIFEVTTPSLGGVLSTFDDQLEGLRLEASLLQSEDSPFTKRRRLREHERAQKLAEARVLAEAQFERIAREKELEALKAQRAEAEAEAQRIQQEAELARVANIDDEDWDPSIDYTEAGHSVIFEGENNLTISPDDSIFADVPSSPPTQSNEAERIKKSLPPRPASQVTTPPNQSLSIGVIGSKQLISLLKGLLPAKPRYVEAQSPYVGSGFQVGHHPFLPPWSSTISEVNWNTISLDNLEQELSGLESLSLAPRAFSPASPLPKRTISLRLKSTNQDQQAVLPPRDDEFNLADFEEHKDPELFEMHETYRALEEQVEEFNFRDLQMPSGQVQLEPTLDPLSEDILEDSFDEGHDLATLDPALPSIADPFDVLEDLSFDEERLTSEFDWEGDTPTNVFGDEPTPTNVFGDDSQPGDQVQPKDDLMNQNTSKGLFSRFFGRTK